LVDFEEVSRAQVFAVLAVLAGADVVSLILAFIGLIPFRLALLISSITAAIGVTSVILYRMKTLEPFKALDAKIPYIYLFMEMYLLAGVSPQEAIKTTSQLLNDMVLYRIYRYISAGRSYEEAFKMVFGKYAGTGRSYIENLVRSGIFGLGGLRYIREALNHILVEREKLIEKTVEQMNMLAEVFVILGVFAPLIAIVTVASLTIFGVTGWFDPAAIMFLLILFSVVVMLLVVTTSKSMVEKVKV
jgi:hypothetical protein